MRSEALALIQKLDEEDDIDQGVLTHSQLNGGSGSPGIYLNVQNDDAGHSLPSVAAAKAGRGRNGATSEPAKRQAQTLRALR